MADIRPRKTRQITDEEIKLKRENEELRSRVGAALKHVDSVTRCRTESAIELWVTTLIELLRGGPTQPADEDIEALNKIDLRPDCIFVVRSRGYDWRITVTRKGYQWERLPKL